MPENARSTRTRDPQTIITAQIKNSTRSDGEVITFNQNLGLFQMVAILPMPDDDEQQTVPVYTKWKINPSVLFRGQDSVSKELVECGKFTINIGLFQLVCTLPMSGDKHVQIEWKVKSNASSTSNSAASQDNGGEQQEVDNG